MGSTSASPETLTKSDLPSSVRELFGPRGDTLEMDAGGAQVRSSLDQDKPVCSTFAEARRAIAPGFGCDRSELVITQSTTDSLCRILAGLELHRGDEVLTTNHEHPGGLAPLAIARDRYGIVIRKATLPVGSHQCAEDYLSIIAAAFTKRTRILMFSAPTATTGAMLPIAGLARLAQEHRAVSIVDGAHLPGMLQCRFAELGCDFLAGSGIKWQGGPPGTGILYARNRVLPQFNPQPLAVFWPVISIWYPLQEGLPPRTQTDVPSYDLAEYLQTTGSSSQLRIQAFQATCETWDRLGRDRIERRILQLSGHLKDRIVELWGEDRLYSPRDDRRLHSGIVAFHPFHRMVDAHEETLFQTFVARLESEHRILAKYTTFWEPGFPAPKFAIRLATRVFHSRDDIDRVVGAMQILSADMN
jgi:isopenicillin-N epimerase